MIKVRSPESVYMNRGNHEDGNMNARYGFIEECQAKCGGHDPQMLEMRGVRLFNVIEENFFNRLPVAGVVRTADRHRQIFLSHGGLPAPKKNPPVRIDELERIPFGPVPEPPAYPDEWSENHPNQWFFDLLWSDPRESWTLEPGRGTTYYKKDSEAFLRANDMLFHVRGHELPPAQRGYNRMHNDKSITVFSASNYCGTSDNFGAVMILVMSNSD